MFIWLTAVGSSSCSTSGRMRAYEPHPSSCCRGRRMQRMFARRSKPERSSSSGGRLNRRSCWRKFQPCSRARGGRQMATILVADDREQERQYLVVLLRHAGHDVVEAEDGLDAIAKISTTAPDLIIADLLMPTMDGFELIRQLRERPETRNTPIVLYTSAYDEVETQALVEHYAAATILPKPSEPEVLLRTIGRILGEALPNRLPFGDDFRHAHLELVTTKLHSKISDLERANSELVQKESQLRLVTNAVPVLISLIDTDLHRSEEHTS